MLWVPGFSSSWQEGVEQQLRSWRWEHTEGCSYHGRPRSRASLEVGKVSVFPRPCPGDLLPPVSPYLLRVPAFLHNTRSLGTSILNVTLWGSFQVSSVTHTSLKSLRLMKVCNTLHTNLQGAAHTPCSAGMVYS